MHRVRSLLQYATERSDSSLGRRRPKRLLCWTTRACSGEAYHSSHSAHHLHSSLAVLVALVMKAYAGYSLC
jgi:hypothetical protein